MKQKVFLMGKTLVAYFSASGVTKKLAQTLADAIGADLFAIEPKVPYTKADLNWMDKQSRSTIEMQNPASRPEIAGTCANIADYDTVFVGFPIWWYVAPTIVNTFLESIDLSGKTVVPFATSGGSGMGGTNKALAPSCKGARLLEGKVFRSSTNGDMLSHALRQSPSGRVHPSATNTCPSVMSHGCSIGFSYCAIRSG